MKRSLSLFICACISLIALAKAPSLNIEKLFDGSYNSDKSVSILISKSKGKYFRSFTVTDNPSLVKKVTSLYRKDIATAEEFQDIISNGHLSYSSMSITNNGQTIQIGISYTSDKTCYLFITGSPEAFK